MVKIVDDNIIIPKNYVLKEFKTEELIKELTSRGRKLDQIIIEVLTEKGRERTPRS